MKNYLLGLHWTINSLLVPDESRLSIPPSIYFSVYEPQRLLFLYNLKLISIFLVIYIYILCLLYLVKPFH